MTSPYRAPDTRDYYAPDFDKHTTNEAVKQLSRVHRSKTMRAVSAYGAVAIFLSAATMGVMSEGCSAFSAQNVKSALDVAKVACIIANAESDIAIVKTVCGIVDAETPALQTILGEQRKASRRFASFNGGAGMARCADAGADSDAAVIK